MANVPQELVVAAFHDEAAAKQALEEIKQLEKQHAVKIRNVALLSKDADGKLEIKEPTDAGFVKGAAWGGVGGAVLGIITGPVGWAALGGAAIGGLVTKLRDSGFEHKRLEEWGERLEPNSSAIIAVVDLTIVEELRKALEALAKEVASFAIEEEIAAQLDAEPSA